MRSKRSCVSRNPLQACSKTLKKRNPLSEVQEAAESFTELFRDYNEAAEGYRLRLYKFVARCYWIGRAFAKNPSSYQRFMDDVFWNDVRQKPRDDEIMKAVLTFAMNAKSKNLRNRVTKTAAVLESLDQHEVKAEHVVVARLKAGGGIEKIYREISGRNKGGSALPDDLDLLKPASPEDDKYQSGDADEDETENSEEESGGGRGDSSLTAIIQPASRRVEKMQFERAVAVGLSPHGRASPSPVVDQRRDLHLFVG